MIIQKLPDELLVQISNHLETPKDLSNLVLCCRHFYSLATPALYSSFNDGEPQQILKFLSTIMARSDLARYVKTFTSSGPHSHWSETTSFLVDAMSVTLKAELAKIWESERLVGDRWYDAISGGQGQVCAWEAVVGLFMLLLPNLSTLSLPRYHDTAEYSICIPVIATHAVHLQDSGISSPYALTNLRDIEIGIFSDDEGAVHWTLETIFPLKSIRSITAEYNFYYDFYNQNIAALAGPFPHVTHFSLQRSDIAPSAFATLLKPFSNLTHLKYSNYGEAEPPFSFYPHEMRLAIIHLHKSLQELVIINNQEMIEEMDYLMGENEGLPLGSLLEFHNLRRLEGTIRTLVGRRLGDPGSDSHLPKDLPTGPWECENTRFAQSLPEELEELVLRVCFEDVFAVVEALFEKRRQGQLKRMRLITLVFAYGITRNKFASESSRCVDEGKRLGIAVARREEECPGSK
jgi:F-box-like